MVSRCVVSSVMVSLVQRAASFAVVAGVTALGAPATTTLAVPAVNMVPQSVLASVAADPRSRRSVPRRPSARTVTPSAPVS